MKSAVTEKEFWEILRNMSAPVDIEYRVYYEDDGTVICYSMDDLPGKYIEIDLETYQKAPISTRVVNEKLIEFDPPRATRKLSPSNEAGTPCDPDNVAVVVDETMPNTRWSIKSYESN